MIYDSLKKNSITLRVASLDQESLNNYLKATKITFVSIYKNELVALGQNSFAEDNNLTNNSFNDLETDYSSKIITEVIGKNFDDGIVGWNLTFSEEETHNSAGRTEGWAPGEHYISGLWIEEIVIQNHQANHDLFVHLYSKKNSFSSWEYRTQCYIDPLDQKKWGYDFVDGPRKWKAIVWSHSNANDYTIWFLDIK